MPCQARRLQRMYSLPGRLRPPNGHTNGAAAKLYCPAPPRTPASGPHNVRTTRRYRKLLIVTSVLAKSVDMLCLVTFLVSMVVIVAATLMYFAERGGASDNG